MLFRDKRMNDDISPNYRPLDPSTIVEYVRSRPELREVFRPGEDLTAQEVGDGNLNLVFKIWATDDPDRTVVIKQALPYLRLVGGDWPLPVDRARIEAEELGIEYRLVPQHTPRVYLYDPDMYLFAMQNLNRHVIMRKGLIRDQVPAFCRAYRAVHGQDARRDVGSGADYRTKKEMVGQFINPELCKITEDLIFTEPYRPTERNLFHKELEPQVLALQADGAARRSRQDEEKFMTHAQALVHGDLHTGYHDQPDGDLRHRPGICLLRPDGLRHWRGDR